MLPKNASLVGKHAFTGKGVPENFEFSIPAAQDLMPAIALNQRDKSGATELSWGALSTARAYFISAIGAKGQDEMVLWTSSELADAGFGLMDYQTNAAVDRWLKDKVLLAPKTTRCSVPKGIFSEGGAMLRMIAYGNELNLAHPPRPQDPKIKWEPEWAVKLRLKSVSNAVLGMHQPSMSSAFDEQPEARQDPRTPPEDQAEEKIKAPQPMDLLKGLFGR